MDAPNTLSPTVHDALFLAPPCLTREVSTLKRCGRQVSFSTPAKVYPTTHSSTALVIPALVIGSICGKTHIRRRPGTTKKKPLAVRASQSTSIRNFTCVCRQASGNSSDQEYPWYFKGRVRFRPALVSVPDAPVADGVQVLSVLGTTLGGSVCLEYDDSPVGPYFEVVQMSAAVFGERLWTAGQWGVRLMVSTDEANSANGDVWGVPSQRREISVQAEGDPSVTADKEGRLQVGGWGDMRFANESDKPFGALPIWWTPTLKALWLPVSIWRNDNVGGTLPLRRLRLSAASLRLRWSPAGDGGDSFSGGDLDGGRFRLPLPFAIEADGVLIEIGDKFDQL